MAELHKPIVPHKAEMILDAFAKHRVTSFADLVAAIGAAFPAVPAILDVNTTTWHPRADLDRVFIERGAAVRFVRRASAGELRGLPVCGPAVLQPDTCPGYSRRPSHGGA